MTSLQRDAKCNLYVYKPEMEAYMPGNSYAFCAGVNLGHASDRDYTIVRAMVGELAARSVHQDGPGDYKIEAGGFVFHTSSRQTAEAFIEIMDDINAHSLEAQGFPADSNVLLFANARR